MMGLKRIAAYLVDYGVIVLWMGLIFFVAMQGWLPFREPDTFTASDRWLAQGQAFLMLTLPVYLYFTISESIGSKATLGKYLLRLHVNGTPRQVVLRNLLKFAPWELAHTAIWHSMPVPLNSEPTLLGWALFAISLSLSAIYLVGLMIANNRTLYDRISGTRVEGLA